MEHLICGSYQLLFCLHSFVGFKDTDHTFYLKIISVNSTIYSYFINNFVGDNITKII